MKKKNGIINLMKEVKYIRIHDKDISKIYTKILSEIFEHRQENIKR